MALHPYFTQVTHRLNMSVILFIFLVNIGAAASFIGFYMPWISIFAALGGLALFFAIQNVKALGKIIYSERHNHVSLVDILLDNFSRNTITAAYLTAISAAFWFLVSAAFHSNFPGTGVWLEANNINPYFKETWLIFLFFFISTFVLIEQAQPINKN